jgi:hypothetical protein
MRKIIINTPRGQYELKAELVALDKTSYYANREGFEKGDDIWNQEMEYTLTNDYELTDWLINDTNWEDWNGLAIQINDEIYTTDKDFWCELDNFKVV